MEIKWAIVESSDSLRRLFCRTWDLGPNVLYYESISQIGSEIDRRHLIIHLQPHILTEEDYSEIAAALKKAAINPVVFIADDPKLCGFVASLKMPNVLTGSMDLLLHRNLLD